MIIRSKSFRSILPKRKRKKMLSGILIINHRKFMIAAFLREVSNPFLPDTHLVIYIPIINMIKEFIIAEKISGMMIS